MNHFDDESIRIYEQKYFCFDFEEDPIAFYTGETTYCADDYPPPSINQELDELLSKHVMNLTIGAAESYHVVDVDISQKDVVVNTIREILTSAGWIEIQEWGCRK